MLSTQDNELLTRVGPGTPMGELLRRYWHPIAAAGELDKKPTKEVTILGEELVLYKDRSGTLGLIGRRCPHRRVSLVYGVPEEDGLRCQYHGWKFDETGRCIEQPFEETVNPEARFKDKVSLPGYPVQALGGLVFAYLGPEPAPLLPRYDLFVWDNVVRQIGAAVIPCNYLQVMENSVDPVHVEWLHNYYFRHVLQSEGVAPTADDVVSRAGRHLKIGFDRFEHGIIKRRITETSTEEDDDWMMGHPIIFPGMLRTGYSFQIRVPIDDTHTWHLWYMLYRPGIAVPPQESVPLYDVPIRDEDGFFITDFVDGQDLMVWATQGEVADRDLERLGNSDLGVIMYRDLLEEQMELVRRGEDPMEVYRNPEDNE